MNHDPETTRLRELAWRRKLTAAEHAELAAWLAADPEAKADWEAEARLNTLLHELPDAPVSSNFTARVMQAVERETAMQQTGRATPWTRLLKSLLPRVAVATIVLCLGLFAWHRHEVTQRAALVRSLMAVSQVESLPDAALLEDFDAIRRLGRAPRVDEELLALMQ